MDEDSFSDVNLDATTESFYHTPQPASRAENGANWSPACSGSPSLCASPTLSQIHSEPAPDDPFPSICENFETGALNNHKTSIVDELLFELYDRCSLTRRTSVDSETYTECSSLSEACTVRQDSLFGSSYGFRYSAAILCGKSLRELQDVVAELAADVAQKNARLIRIVRSRDRTRARQRRYCDLVTAIVQAASEKRSVDSKMRFSIEPPAKDDEETFDQWKDAVRAVVRLPAVGLPQELRRRIWTALAKCYIHGLHINWSKTVRFAFNEKSNPDDDALGLQIVKDLHRTGCGGLVSQAEAEDERAALRRVLLAYARWNKAVGYCQGFNILASLLLDVTSRTEDEALQVMIYLVDGVLPNGYFAQNLRALSVDMAVFRSYMHMKMPALANHLDYLQASSKDATTGTSYEPPLTNVFTMQWFLTMFATCLPRDAVLRLWDAVLLDGSEMLIRAALAIWSRLARPIMRMKSADEFYVAMGSFTHDMLEGKIITASRLIKTMYEIAPYPLQHLTELREKLTYNIAPLCNERKLLTADTAEDADDAHAPLACFRVMPAPRDQDSHRPHSGSSSKLPTAGLERSNDSGSSSSKGLSSERGVPAKPAYHGQAAGPSVTELERQYRKLKERQRQAHVIVLAANEKAKSKIIATSVAERQLTGCIPVATPVAINHLFIGRQVNDAADCQRPAVPEQAAVPLCPRLSGSGDRVHSVMGARQLPSSHSTAQKDDVSGAAHFNSEATGTNGICQCMTCNSSIEPRPGMIASTTVAGNSGQGCDQQTEFKRLLVKGLREGLFKYTTYTDGTAAAAPDLLSKRAESKESEICVNCPSPSSDSYHEQASDDLGSSPDSIPHTTSLSSSVSSADSPAQCVVSRSQTMRSRVDATSCDLCALPGGQYSQDEAGWALSCVARRSTTALAEVRPGAPSWDCRSAAEGRGLNVLKPDVDGLRLLQRQQFAAKDSRPVAAAARAPSLARKTFNPFPVDGRVLSARKVAQGTRLGLYAPQSALSGIAAQQHRPPAEPSDWQRGATKGSRSAAW